MAEQTTSVTIRLGRGLRLVTALTLGLALAGAACQRAAPVVSNDVGVDTRLRRDSAPPSWSPGRELPPGETVSDLVVTVDREGDITLLYCLEGAKRSAVMALHYDAARSRWGVPRQIEEYSDGTTGAWGLGAVVDGKETSLRQPSGR